MAIECSSQRRLPVLEDCGKTILLVAALLLLLGVSLLSGCGAMGNGSNSSSSSPAITTGGTSSTGGTGSSGGTDISTASNFKLRVLVGQSHKFSVPATNVIWRVNGIPGGNSTLGTISAAGLYAAPATVPIDPVLVISAVSVSDGAGYFTTIAVGALGKRFAYLSSAADDSIQVLSLDTQVGALQPVSIFAVGPGKGPAALALSPNGKFLYSLNRGSNDISVLGINPATGQLTEVGTVATPDGPYEMVFSAKGNFAYVSCDGASVVAAYALDLSTGALTALAGGSYVAGGGKIHSLAITHDGRFLYAVDRDANQILGLAVDESTGSLSPVAGSPFAAQPGLLSIAVSRGNYASDYTHLYAGSNNGVEAYERHPSSGSLTYVPGATQHSAGESPTLFRNTSDGILMGVDPQNGGGFSFSFDYLGLPPGALAPGGFPVTTGISPIAGGWAWSENPKDWNWVLVLNREADVSSIGIYQVDYTNGLAGPTATFPTALHDATGLVITP